jgi:XTP/dITP diphosphohydrolase
LTERLLLATTNPGKITEMQAYMEDLPLEVHALLAWDRFEPFPEKGETFLENARGKSIHYSRGWEGITLGEDSGLEIDFLGGAPGVLSARFAGPRATDAENIQKVLDLMQGVPWARRRARFVSTMVLSRKGQVLVEIEATAEGYLLDYPQGSYGFGYDPIFYFPPLKKTFAELVPQEKNRVSHRGQALNKFKRFLRTHFGL